MKKIFINAFILTTSVFLMHDIAHAAKVTKKSSKKAAASSASSTAPAKEKPAEAKPVEVKPTEVKAAEAKPTEEKTIDASKAIGFSAKDVWNKELFERDDNKVLVIQDRKYNKAKRLELGVDMGMTAATAFYNSYTLGGRAAYYFNEYWGLQGFANYSLNTSTREKDQLEEYLYKSNFESTKEFKQPRFFTGLGVLWNPIYGKFAWFRTRIIHFDIYGGLGLSYLTTESTFNKSKLGATRKGAGDKVLGTLANLGIRIYISKSMAWTTEVRNNVYQATYEKTTTGGGGIDIPEKKVWQNNFQVVTGVSWLFNLGGY